ncbi:cytochrome P450 [Lentzea flava]|uniref:Cytochrome P450 n=1 Tax=Lentzea flava TaxID=103732 RepID=A0ABQ2UGA0_9PSEU|nr:cytochrome P450 [Lentzea flava]MCP2198300.1 Cytochrome P450 [Lentzea flava]GGU31739.1 cytochrome P450 [Lentzea flava]
MTEEVTAPAPACPFPFPRDPHRPLDLPPEYARLRAERPVQKVTTPAGDTAWLVSRYADVRALLADTERFSAEVMNPGYPRYLFPVDPQPGAFVTVDPPEHTHYRRMIMSMFTKKKAEEVRPQAQKLVDERIDAILKMPQPVDLVTHFARPIPLTVVCELLGVPYKDRLAFGRWINTLVETTSSQAHRNAAAGALFGYLTKLVAQKEKEPTDDVLGRLVSNQMAAGELKREEAVVIGMMLLSAGYDTTASSIALSILTLLEHPDQLVKLRENPDLIVGAVEELLRHQNVMQCGVGRVAKVDLEIAGQPIKAGEGIIALLSSADRDESVYSDPDTLDITRKDSTPLAFGHGIHSCIAKFLSRVELQVALLTLITRIPTLALAKPADELRFRDGAIVYSLRELPVTW